MYVLGDYGNKKSKVPFQLFTTYEAAKRYIQSLDYTIFADNGKTLIAFSKADNNCKIIYKDTKNGN